MLSETRYMARSYKPFARRYDKSCLYYNVTGNRRFQYMYDPSCEYNRDAYGRTQMVVREGLGSVGFGAPSQASIKSVAEAIDRAGQDLAFRVVAIVKIMDLVRHLGPDARVEVLGQVSNAVVSGSGNVIFGDLVNEALRRLQDEQRLATESSALPKSTTSSTTSTTSPPITVAPKMSTGVKIGIGVGVATGLTALVFALRQYRSSGMHGAGWRG